MSLYFKRGWQPFSTPITFRGIFFFGWGVSSMRLCSTVLFGAAKAFRGAAHWLILWVNSWQPRSRFR